MGKSRDIDRFDPFDGYQPTRPARLRPLDGEPPPLPPPASLTDGGFGEADEDGLRILAALETLTSLEPDYSDDLAAEEASVTIIESAASGNWTDGFGADAAAARPLRDLLRQSDQADYEPGLLLNGYETFLAPGDEAVVEIVEVGHHFEDADVAEPPTRSPSHQPTSLAERIAAATGPSGRFFKALSGG